jgi:hypothetical protein
MSIEKLREIITFEMISNTTCAFDYNLLMALKTGKIKKLDKESIRKLSRKIKEL